VDWSVRALEPVSFSIFNKTAVEIRVPTALRSPAVDFVPSGANVRTDKINTAHAPSNIDNGGLSEVASIPALHFNGRGRSPLLSAMVKT